MASDKITLDLKYAQDLVDFWSQKVEGLKADLATAEEKAQAHASLEGALKDAQDALAAETAKREAAEADAAGKLAQGQQDRDYWRDRQAAQDKEIKDLLVRLAKSDQERAALTHQVTHLYSQASVLAAEADQSRKARIAELYPPVHFVEESFVSQTLHISDPARFIANLPERFRTTERLYFLPRPPSCMPLRVPACGQPGYWFYPLWVPTADNPEFELIVEGQPSLWTYLGRYTTSPLPSADMRLSEWMVLDEQTKLAHAARVANQGLAAGQKASYATEIDVKRRYELGEWSVPCYSLRCVGFGRALYELMHATVAARVDGSSTIASTPAPSTPMSMLS